MPEFTTVTLIRAAPEICFDLARDVGLHLESFRSTGERVAEGRQSGLLELDEEIVWEGRHFGLWWRHRARITEFRRPDFFQDTMVEGAFQTFQHDHLFYADPEGTRMVDTVRFQAPGWLPGAFVARAVLQPWLRRLIMRRAQVLRKAGETTGSS